MTSRTYRSLTHYPSMSPLPLATATIIVSPTAQALGQHSGRHSTFLNGIDQEIQLECYKVFDVGDEQSGYFCQLIYCSLRSITPRM
ncbi:hypothetical protein J6590_024633 [Homalodisca vitripennis]|nr:hypothetical protein J6590_024633 [Homalodisca vitripennis]